MTIHQSSDGTGQGGNPNLEAMQRLQKEWGKAEVDSAILISEVAVAALASGSSVGISVDIPIGAEIIDVKVIPTVSSSGGTMQVKTGSGVNAVTNVMTCATDKIIARATSIDDAYKYVTADGMRVFSHAEADAAKVYLYYKRNL
jgi:hypothetical protein